MEHLGTYWALPRHDNSGFTSGRFPFIQMNRLYTITGCWQPPRYRHGLGVSWASLAALKKRVKIGAERWLQVLNPTLSTAKAKIL